jgi:hypothetical protein
VLPDEARKELGLTPGWGVIARIVGVSIGRAQAAQRQQAMKNQVIAAIFFNLQSSGAAQNHGDLKSRLDSWVSRIAGVRSSHPDIKPHFDLFGQHFEVPSAR